MLRSGPSRALLRSLISPTASQVRFTTSRATHQLQLAAKVSSISIKRPKPLAIAPYRPGAGAVIRYASQVIPGKPDTKAEAEAGEGKLEVHPDLVSAESSVHPLFHEVATPDPEPDTDMMAGIRNDLKTIRDTFSLDEVPREAYYLGLAGLLPYAATSAGTIYCAWEIHRANENGGIGFLMTDHTAELALHVLEPLQIGYGAVIISFLGAIHWGLEFAGYGGHFGYRRYAIGVVAPAVAWPTTLLPIEYALVAQFLAFNFLYYADSRATTRGWAPPWYGVYRFVLTFIVGASIVATLIGRGQIADLVGKLPGPADRVRQLRQVQSDNLAKEEELKRKNMALRSKKPAEEDEEEESEEE